MSQTVSPGAEQPYGIQRVCRIWEQARSTFYNAGRQESGDPPKRRGPRPSISDEDLLELIRHDLATSPFTGEGHRKVWARLRVRDGVRVSRKRVLRLMRENHLLSPHRGRPKSASKAHDGKIVTMAPNLMWGTDGTRVFTLDEGWVWIFTAVEHWNAECVGWHVCKKGDRYAALQPLSMAFEQPLRRCAGRSCPRTGSADGSWHPVPLGSFSEPVEVLGNHSELRLRCRASNQRSCRTL